jgi:hypothetical protein
MQTKTRRFYRFFSLNFVFWRFFAMEPFGLFQLLQSFLASAPNTAQPTPPAEPQNAETPTPTPPQTPPEKKEEVGYSYQAIMGFLSEHDRRAGRIKK